MRTYPTPMKGCVYQLQNHAFMVAMYHSSLCTRRSFCSRIKTTTSFYARIEISFYTQTCVFLGASLRIRSPEKHTCRKILLYLLFAHKKMLFFYARVKIVVVFMRA